MILIDLKQEAYKENGDSKKKKKKKKKNIEKESYR